MSLSTAKNHSVYITKILLACFQHEVKQSLDATINSLLSQHPGTNIIDSFIGALTDELALLSHMNKDVGRWSNIYIARDYLHQMRKKTEATFPLSLTTYV